MQSSSVAGTDTGKTRYNNEDSFFADDTSGLYAVADGVGGANAGEMASRLFCDVVGEYRDAFSQALSSRGDDATVRRELLALMEQLFQRATDRIYQLSQKNPEYRGMATTGIVLAVGPRGAVLGHVGDSRAYLLRGDEAQRLTVDHTLAQEMVSQGLLQPQEVENFAHKNVLARAVGQLPGVRVDTAWLDIAEGDRVLLCSDGLYRYFTDVELASVVSDGVSAAIDAANAAGGLDNVTAVIVSAESGSASRRRDVGLHTQSKVMAIQNLFLFKYLNYQEMVSVLKVVYERHFAPGEVICREGDRGDAMFIVFGGAVDVSRGAVHLTTVGPGGHFGEVAFMDGQPRSATAIAREPTTVLVIDRNDFHALTRTDPAVACKLLWCFVLNLSDRVRDLTDSLAQRLPGALDGTPPR